MRFSIKTKLLGGFLSIALLMTCLGLFSIYELNQVNEISSEIADNWLPSTRHVGAINTATSDFRIAQLSHNLATDTAEMQRAEQALEAQRRNVAAGVAAYEPLVTSSEEKARFESFKKQWTQYLADHERGFLPLSRANRNDEAAAFLRGDHARLFESLSADLSALVTINVNGGEAASVRGDEVYAQSQKLIIASLVGALLAAVALGYVLSTAITRAVVQVAGVASQIAREDLPALVRVSKALADGDLTQDAVVTAQAVSVSSKDELGDMAADFNAMIAGLQETGDAFSEMTANLRDVIGQVQASAEGVAGTSEQLGQAASQTSGVVQQVTQAVQNVAAGSGEASRSAQATNEAVVQFGQAIDGIARGASEQARQVQTVSATATQMAAGVEQVASNAHSVASASQQTRASAEQGARAVRETVDGMAEIKVVVADAASKVEELGKLGEKIGAVVETIDDIAEQTNLLALNAAIEAARAGEHGRGFAVVADEVRKLAERSQRETKAISELIRDVQAGTRDAVTAMAQGSVRVEEGSAKADEAGRALGEILSAVEATVSQVTQIATAAQEMATGARGVVDAMGSISAVVEENSAATEEMAAQAGQVTTSIESIAAVSEENSAATEEVSASAEEMSAQVEEMNAQAEELAATAEQLKSLVARFRLHSAERPASARVSWQRAA